MADPRDEEATNNFILLHYYLENITSLYVVISSIISFK